jgi:hypothetical protein
MIQRRTFLGSVLALCFGAKLAPTAVSEITVFNEGMSVEKGQWVAVLVPPGNYRPLVYPIETRTMTCAYDPVEFSGSGCS